MRPSFKLLLQEFHYIIEFMCRRICQERTTFLLKSIKRSISFIIAEKLIELKFILGQSSRRTVENIITVNFKEMQ